MQKLNVSYSTIKQLFSKIPSYYISQGDGGYLLLSVGESDLISCKISSANDISDFNDNYKLECTSALSVDDVLVLGKLANNIPFITPRNEDGFSFQIQEPRTGTELIMATHNFCDRTTWHYQSERVTDEVLESIDGYNYQCAHINIIDLTHGKLFDEDSICEDVEHGYFVIVKVNGVTKQQREPFALDGGDYDVDYALGKITFFTDQTGNEVTVSYSYENGSFWVLKPDDGKRIDIEQAEVQFSVDCEITTDIQFQIWVYNPYDLPNKVMYDQTCYKTIRNLIDEALGSYPVIPAFGGAARGVSSEVYGFPFRYGSVRKLNSSIGVELRIGLKNDIPLEGEYVTATFYTTVRTE
jgi:hypothetical protein